jgi:hypothetical protein
VHGISGLDRRRLDHAVYRLRQNQRHGIRHRRASRDPHRAVTPERPRGSWLAHALPPPKQWIARTWLLQHTHPSTAMTGRRTGNRATPVPVPVPDRVQVGQRRPGPATRVSRGSWNFGDDPI